MTLLMFVAVTVVPYPLCALQVDVGLVNGNFEAGDLAGWIGWDYNYYTYGKMEVVASVPSDPADKGNYVFEGNDYSIMGGAASDVWEADTQYTVSLDVWNSPGDGYNPFVSINPADNDSPWSGWSSGNPWRLGIGGLGETLPDGWCTREVSFTTESAGGLGIGETIQMGLQVWSNSGDEEVYARLDNVRVIKTVESYVNPRYLTMTAPSGATVSPAAGQHVYEHNTTVNIGADLSYEDGGTFYTFDHWDSAGKAPQEPSQRVTTIVMDANSVLTAVYVQSAAVTLTVNGPPGVGTTPPVGQKLYAQGTTVNVSAPEVYSHNGDYRTFSRWKGSVADANAAGTTVLMDADKTITAVYDHYARIITDSKVLAKQPGKYIGWPSIAVAPNGDLLAVFSGNRAGHVSNDGIIQMVRSSDGGLNWSSEVTVFDTPIDDRDCGIIQTDDETMLVNWFTGPYGTEWQGHWTIRSTDNGYTWDTPVRTEVTTPHGPIQLSDGRILYIGQRPHSSYSWDDFDFDVGIQESVDDGLSWQTIGTFPVPPNDLTYDECHFVECASGKLVLAFRDYVRTRPMLQTESTDGGATWSAVHETGIDGFPPHLIRLQNDWLLAVYGKRWAPYGEYACISRDEGVTWDVENEIKLSSAPNGDLGYPASTQLADGSIWTVYYQQEFGGGLPRLMGTHWQLNISVGDLDFDGKVDLDDFAAFAGDWLN